MNKDRIETAISIILTEFARRNDFTTHITALQDVTPAQWAAQVNAACERLETVLNGSILEVEQDLHDGTFGSAVNRKR